VRKLNIFVDETGEFGFGNNASELYGVSFTFHEKNEDINVEINNLNNRLNKIGYNKMIHMASLVARSGEYKDFEIKTRKSIFNAIYQFSRKINVKYCTIIVNKRYNDSKDKLLKELQYKINEIIRQNENYFKKFDIIALYYDNGQETLAIILDTIFSYFDGYRHIVDFNHEEKRLFQVSDMLTFIDKYDYKYKNKMSFTKNEKYFFSNEEMRKILKELNKKRL